MNHLFYSLLFGSFQAHTIYPRQQRQQALSLMRYVNGVYGLSNPSSGLESVRRGVLLTVKGLQRPSKSSKREILRVSGTSGDQRTCVRLIPRSNRPLRLRKKPSKDNRGLWFMAFTRLWVALPPEYLRMSPKPRGSCPHKPGRSGFSPSQD